MENMSHLESTQKVKQFDGTNFSNWKYRVGILLEEKNLEKFLKDPLETLLGATTDEKVKDKLKSDEKKCKSILVQCIADSQLEYIKDKAFAKDIYDTLTGVFERKSVAGQLLLRKQLLTMKYKDGDDISEFFLRFDRTVRELKSIGATLEELDVVCHLLLTLPKSFDSLVTALETMDQKNLTIDFVKSRLLDECGKRTGGGSQASKSSDSAAMQADFSKAICHRCKKPGHIRANCRVKLGKKNGSNNKKGADANCAEEYDDPEFLLCEEQSKRGESTVNCGYVASCLSAKSVDGFERIEFVLDSGATHHIVNNKMFFNNLRKIEPIVISTAKSGTSLMAKQQGDISIKTFFKDDCSTKTIQNVLFVENLKCNLMSIRQLTGKGYEITFNGDVAFVSRNGKRMFAAHRDGQLYRATFYVERSVFAGIADAEGLSKASQNLWHFRLGHLNANDMKKMLNRGMVTGLDKLKVNIDAKLCEPCVIGKQTRLPYPTRKEIRSKRILELVHSDVSGPMSQPAHDGSRYFVSFTDDFSRASMVYCIKRKSEVFDKFQQYVAMAEAQHGRRIAQLQLDNGGEYCSTEFKCFCNDKGIQLKYTVAYNPEMNAVSERFNRTVVEKARTMLLSSGLDRRFWNEAVLYANYVRNRSPTSAVGEQFANKTPAEIWYQKKPDLAHLRVFGSVCYNHVPKENRTKFDAKSTKCYMLGYGHSSYTYRLWDIEGEKLIIGRNVTFNEKSFFERLGCVDISDAVAAENDDACEENCDHDAISECIGNNKSNCNHDVNKDNIGDINENHNANLDGIGDDQDKVNSVSSDLNHIGNNGGNDIHGATGSTGNNELRRSQRQTKKPDRFDDIAWFAGFALSAEEFVQGDPVTIDDAKKRADWPEWQKAMNDELSSLQKNGTWSLCKLPAGRKAISCKWVFKLKYKSNGDVDKYKARLVARGFAQEKGFDYNETYSPTAKLTTFRVLLSIANHFGYHMHQMDVKCAFLNGQLKEDIYMTQPDGCVKEETMVCKLNKSLYGLKQASRVWNERLNHFMIANGFNRCESDHCLYTKFDESDVCYVLLYVDDLAIISSSMRMVNETKSKLAREFEMTDIGKIDSFLGIQVERNSDGVSIALSQSRYMRNMVKKFCMDDCKAAATPMENGLSLAIGDKEKLTKQPYRELIGCLTYATQTTRPDLCASTNYFSRFQGCCTDEHFVYAKRILRYIQGTADMKMVYRRNAEADILTGYADSDWAGDKTDRKSTSGYVFKVFGNTISWLTQKQPTIALSSTEAEYYALGMAICEAMWLRSLLVEIGHPCGTATTILEDNQSCIRVAEEPREHKRMKHIDVKYSFIRDTISKKEVKLKYVSTSDQTADIMTKALGRILFEKHRSNLNLT